MTNFRILICLCLYHSNEMTHSPPTTKKKKKKKKKERERKRVRERENGIWPSISRYGSRLTLEL